MWWWWRVWLFCAVAEPFCIFGVVWGFIWRNDGLRTARGYHLHHHHHRHKRTTRKAAVVGPPSFVQARLLRAACVYVWICGSLFMHVDSVRRTEGQRPAWVMMMIMNEMGSGEGTQGRRRAGDRQPPPPASSSSAPLSLFFTTRDVPRRTMTTKMAVGPSKQRHPFYKPTGNEKKNRRRGKLFERRSCGFLVLVFFFLLVLLLVRLLMPLLF